MIIFYYTLYFIGFSLFFSFILSITIGIKSISKLPPITVVVVDNFSEEFNRIKNN